jgi:hypothetical protein
MKTYHVATINAFPNKFGTFTGVIRDEATREVIRERFSTYDDARNWIKSKAWEMFGPVKYASIRRKGEYLANCWSDAE